jgi:SAM-dependent methyltransferase
VLEVGAGAGYITTELAERCSEVVAIEPTKELHHTLIAHTQAHTNVIVVNAILSDYVRSRPASLGNGASTTTDVLGDLFDAVVYINVLEHIEHDGAELALATSLLRPGGRVLIVVPAHQWLYAKVDRLTGHFRRYSKKSLLAVTRDNGLRIESMRYFDSVGLVPYLVLYKWLRSTATTGTNATIYSRVIMPISYLIYRIFRGRVIGKNLIAVAAIAS